MLLIASHQAPSSIYRSRTAQVFYIRLRDTHSSSVLRFLQPPLAFRGSLMPSPLISTSSNRSREAPARHIVSGSATDLMPRTCTALKDCLATIIESCTLSTPKPVPARARLNDRHETANIMAFLLLRCSRKVQSPFFAAQPS